MSQDRKDNSITPDWDEGELDWLNDQMTDGRPAGETDGGPDLADWEEIRAGGEAVPPRAERQGRIRPEEYEPYDGGAEKDGRAGGAYYRRERRQRTSAPLIILMVILLGGMLFAGWQLASIFLNYRRDRSAYNDLAESAISALAEKDEPGSAPAAMPQEELSTAPVLSEVPIQVDWDYLRSVNSDVVGWLYGPNTVINYPVVQSVDHEYYLDHGFDGGSNKAGTLFVDRDSVAGIVQSNYIIYGHNMKDGSMFASFQEYVNESYFRENPILYYLTPSGNYRVEILGAHTVESTLDNFPTYFSGASAYEDYLNEIVSRFYWVNRDALSTDRQLMTLSTCSYSGNYQDPRFLLHGMMVPIQ